jgi:tetratricopeptide (TPR) repeat protein
MDSRVSDFSLTIERPIALASTLEVVLLRQALAANPASIPLRAKLAFLLFIQDQFDEAIDLYSQLLEQSPQAGWAVMLAECHISKETPEADAEAGRLARLAAALAVDDHGRAEALAALGKVLIRQGRHDEARATLLAGLEANPKNTNVYKRLATLDLNAGAPEEVLDTADQLLGKGVGHARLLAARALAFADQGAFDKARDAVGLDRFLHRETLSPPEGWPDIAAFNAAVRAELTSHPDLRYDRYGTASHKTWRIDRPAFSSSVAIPALQQQIRRAVIDQVARLDAQDSPWTKARPADGILHNWCVLTDAEGYEEWHVHQGGWMSGVYYVDVPAAVSSGSGREGCIAFGLPENLVGDEASRAFGETLVRPESGLLLLFPSHSYHRTFPHGSDDRRICLAFDIQPG